MVPTTRLALLSLFLFAAASSRVAAAEKKKPDTTVKEEARVTVVEVPVNVVDKNGRPVEGLTADDFEVYDDGVKQQISGLDVVDERRSVPRPTEGEAPIHPAARRHFLLLFDMSFSSPKGVINARNAARDFIVTRMKELDLAAVATFSVETGMRLVLSFTQDRTQLAAAVDSLGFPTLLAKHADPLNMTFLPPAQTNSTGFAYNTAVGSTGAGVNTGDSILQDILENLQVQQAREIRAIYRDRVSRLTDSLKQLAQVLDAVKGRKHILLLSEGFDSRELSGSSNQGGGAIEGEWVARGEFYKLDSDVRFGNTLFRKTMGDVLALFNRSDCVIHAVDIGGIRALSDIGGSFEATRNYQDSLFYISNETGGEFLKNTNDLGNSFDKLLERTGLIYVLAFQLVRVPETGKFHTLKVKVKNSSYHVSARSGYYEPKSYDKFSAVEKKLVAASALAAALPKTDIPAWVLASPLPLENGLARVPIIVEVPGDRLLAKVQAPSTSLDLYLYAIDQEHQTRDNLYHTISFDLTKVRDRLERTGVKYYGEMRLPPGDYTLRVLVRNNETGRFGVSVTPVTVHEPSALYTSPPLFVEAAMDWIMVRGKPRTGQDVSSDYPFAIEGESFVPEALPNVKSGDTRQVCLIAYNVTGEAAGMKYTGRILGEDGRPHGRAELTLLRESEIEGAGARKLLLRFQPHGLNPGRYALAVKLQDSAGKSSESTFPFDVR